MPSPTLGLIECRHGPMLYLLNDWLISRSIVEYGEWGEGEIGLLAEWLRPGDVVVEVGSNIGAHTVPLAKLVGPAGQVVAIEAQAFVFNVLCGNLALNGLQNVRPVHAAAGDRSGPIEVPVFDYSTELQNYGAVTLIDNEQLYADRSFSPVDQITLDSLKLKAVRLIKMDVEGMESAVLRGARYLIERSRPVIYLEADRPSSYAALAAWLRKYRYGAWWHPVALYQPTNYRGAAEDRTGSTGSLNLICLPQEMGAPARKMRSFLDYFDQFGAVLPRTD